MKSNMKSLVELAEEVQRIEEVKQDYVVNHNSIFMVNDDETIGVDGVGDYKATDHCHSQIATKLKIPKQYYDRMGNIEGLRSTNVNAWLHKEDGNKLVRTLDNNARAFLSDRFKPIDNGFIMQAFLPVLQEHKGLEVKSQNLSEKRLYLQLGFPQLQAEVKQGDVIQAGVILTNSEVGAGAVDIKTVLWRLICSNGMIGTSLLRRHHIGKRIDTENEESYNIFQDDTIKAELESFRLRMRDVLKHSLTEASFQAQINKLKEATEDKIEKVTKTVENVTKRLNISECYQDSMIENIHTEGNRSRYGMANSITNLAHKIENPDLAYEYERLGDKVINLSPSEWKVMVA